MHLGRQLGWSPSIIDDARWPAVVEEAPPCHEYLLLFVDLLNRGSGGGFLIAATYCQWEFIAKI